MSKGFITVAQNSGHGDYIRMAYALALSLKKSQSDGAGLSILVDDADTVPDRYRWAFDEVIPLKQDDAQDEWKIHNKWQAYDLSPYDQTIMVDADMLFTVDLAGWWEILSLRNVWACTEPVNFQGLPLPPSPYREDFDRNELPHVYTAMMYFDRSSASQELFDASRIVFQNWNSLRTQYFRDRTPKKVSGDLAFATAMKMLQTVDTMTWSGIEFPQFVHMRGRVLTHKQGSYHEDWREHVRAYLTPNHHLIVGNYLQTAPFHYHIKEWLTDDIIDLLEVGHG